MPLYANRVKRVKKKAKSTLQPRKISSPKLLQQFSPVGRMIRRNSYLGTFGSVGGGSATKEPAPIATEKNASEVHSPAAGKDSAGSAASLDTFTQHQRLLSATNVAAAATAKKDPVAHSKKSHFFQEAVQKTTEWVIEDCKGDSVMFCKCGKICKEAFNLCEECIATGKLHEAGGYLYLKRDQNNLDRYWFQLINKELYCMVPRSISFTNRL